MDQGSPQIEPLLKQRPKKRFKILLYALIIVLILSIVVTAGISSYIGWQLTHPPTRPLETTPAKMQLAYEDIEFKSRGDELKMKGWYMPPKEQDNNMTVIIAHGYKQNRVQADVPALEIADKLVDSGYGVVMFDFRNSGESEGSVTSVGQFEKNDLLGAIDWVKAQSNGQIALLGFSMGATTSILAAAEEPEVAGVLVDSPFSKLRTYLEDNLSVWSDLPKYPFTPFIMAIIPPLTGLSVDEVDALAAVDDVYPRPILFIHGEEDTKIPFSESEKMWKKHPDAFDFWKAPKGDHMEVYQYQKELYFDKMFTFLDNLPSEN